MGRIMYGLLGEKLGHSLSPSIHKMIFEELGIDAGYNLFEVEKSDLKDAMYGFRALGIRGINVTIPYKIAVMQYLDEISAEAAKISAVNTILFEGGRMKGYNTDYHGFGMLLKRNGINTEGRSAIILGSGGSAKAVWQYLSDSGAREIKVVSRDSSRQITGFGDSCIISYEELRQIEAGVPQPESGRGRNERPRRHGCLLAASGQWRAQSRWFCDKHAVHAGFPAGCSA